MGYDLQLFSEAVDPDFKCRLCSKVLEEPLSTKCGHVFCASCILPWVMEKRSCPLQCQPISAKELHQVLPLRNLIQKLEIKCEYQVRGCGKRLKLQDLASHLEMCDYSPTLCHNKGCSEVMDLKDMDSHMRESCDYRAVGICQKGCGLVLLHRDQIQGTHCCLQALRSHNAALLGKSASLELELKRQASKGSKREKSLIAQLSSMQNEVQLTALRYQKFSHYMAKINSRTRSRNSPCKEEEPKQFFWKNDTLGYNIVGGCPSQGEASAEGFYVSKVLPSGPADTAEGPRAHDNIIEPSTAVNSLPKD